MQNKTHKRSAKKRKTDGVDPRPRKIEKSEGIYQFGCVSSFTLLGVWLRGGGKELKRYRIP
jgi:hypothetical protein